MVIWTEKKNELEQRRCVVKKTLLIACCSIFILATCAVISPVFTDTGPLGLMASEDGGRSGFAGLNGSTVVEPADIGSALKNVSLNNAPGATEVKPDLLMPNNSFAYSGGQASKDADIAQQHNQVVPTVTEKVAGDMGGTTPLIMPTVVSI